MKAKVVFCSNLGFCWKWPRSNLCSIPTWWQLNSVALILFQVDDDDDDDNDVDDDDDVHAGHGDDDDDDAEGNFTCVTGWDQAFDPDLTR